MSALPEELYPPASNTSADGKAKTPPYKITLIIHPSAIRVSYSTVSTLVPNLVKQHSPDFILHIGMAGGRDCYSLETRAHRDGYRIKDVDDADGFTWGEGRWKKEGVPDVLYVAWDEQDVLRRWEQGVQTGLAERGFLGRAAQDKVRADQLLLDNALSSSGPRPAIHPARGGDANVMWGTGNMPVSSSRADDHRRKGTVKLSCDAGRFLCEYALFESLSRRWLDAQQSRESENDDQEPGSSDSARDAPATSSIAPSATDADTVHPPTTVADAALPLPLERLGKVAFLHVPGWTGVEDINRGVMVAEEAIRALVGSWEAGNRRGGGHVDGVSRSTSASTAAPARAYTTQHSEVAGRTVGVGR